jgi:hypothetical protein
MDGDDAVTIRWLSIENFRGFRTEQTIDLAASATIVSGSNGKGKTSFFDALQWLLLGSLRRLANLASRRSGNYIVNGFAGPTALAKVGSPGMIVGEVTRTLVRVGVSVRPVHRRGESARVRRWRSESRTRGGR